MRLGVLPGLFISVLSIVALPSAAHASIPFWGPIIPVAYNSCAANFGLVIEVINRIIQLSITLAIVIVAPVMFAWAGFDIIVNPTNPGKLTEARQRMLNVVIGIVIALAAWMIVDALMAVLYRPTDDATFTETWFNLIRTEGSPPCIELAGSLNIDPDGAPYVGTDTGGVYYPPPNGTGACDPNVLKGIIPELEDWEANTFACLAGPESTCGTRMKNFSWNIGNSEGLASSAYGAFQILLSLNHKYFETESCYQAAGVSGPLSCNRAFTNGFPKTNEPEILNNCLKAASDLSCNFEAAYQLYKVQGFSAWTADSRHKDQQACIDRYPRP